MNYLNEQNKKCNYAGYLDKHLKYPPKGLLPLPGQSVEADPGCDIWTDIFEAAVLINPAFNEYRIFDMVSIDTSAPFALTDSLVVSRFVGRSGIPVSFFGFLRVH